MLENLTLNNLNDIWEELTSNYTNNIGLINEFWNEIVNCYSSKGRHYHNMDHLEYMIKLAHNYKSEIVDFDTLLFSIFYHDIVYNTQRSDNELESAQLAGNRLERLGLISDQVVKCHEQIMATKEHNNDTNADINSLVDFDLAILGDEPERYLEYTKKIRKEYSIYSDFMYTKGRRKVLRHFLEMESIFKTEEFKVNFEQRARKNLKVELGENYANNREIL